MIKLLIKKQIYEMIAGLGGQDNKKKKAKKRLSFVGYVFIYLLIFVSVGAVMSMMADRLCGPLVMLDLEWLYLTYMSLMALAVGIIGMVFNAYSVLYKAKDNDFLLSLPIKPGHIIFSKILSEYIFSVAFTAMVMVPAIIIWNINADVSVGSNITACLIIFVLALFVLTLGCVLAWVVALITSHMKTTNTNIAVIVLSLVLVIGYYIVYFKAQELLNVLLENSVAFAEQIDSSMNPLYLLGNAAYGDIFSFLIITAAVAVIFGIMYYVLSKSFFQIATANKGAVHKVYKEKNVKQSEVGVSLLKREFGRLINSPAYFLNGAMPSIITFLGTIAVLVFHEKLTSSVEILIENSEGDISEMITFLAAAVLGMLVSMVNISAPSISLEGKTFWIIRSFPVKSWTILRTKLVFSLLVALPAALLLIASLLTVYFPGILNVVFVVLFICAMTVYNAEFGLMCGLVWPRMEWANETAAVKQGVASLLSVFSGYILFVPFGIGFALYGDVIGILNYGFLCLALIALIDVVLFVWLKKRGIKRYENIPA